MIKVKKIVDNLIFMPPYRWTLSRPSNTHQWTEEDPSLDQSGPVRGLSGPNKWTSRSEDPAVIINNVLSPSQNQN